VPDEGKAPTYRTREKETPKNNVECIVLNEVFILSRDK
jgi:hypothetical protein